MAALSAQQIGMYAYAAGFRGEALVKAIAIALAESGGQARIQGDLGLQTSLWGPSVGLWQIRSMNGARRTGDIRDAFALPDPQFNAHSAFVISGGGSNFRPWSMYTNGGYQRYMPQARAAVAGGLVPGSRGGAGGGAPAPIFSAASPGFGGVPGIGGNPVPAGNPADVAKSLYGYLGWFIDQPEVGPIILRAAREGWDIARLQGALVNTHWWRTTSESARNWDALLAMDHATAVSRLRETGVSIRQQADRFGIRLPSLRLYGMAVQALRQTWSPAQIQLALAAEMRWHPGRATGGVADLMNQVRTVAANYLIPVTERQAWEWARRIVGGAGTMEAVEAQMRMLAAARFPHLKTQIAQGIAPAQYFQSQRQTIAQLLEKPVESIDFVSDRRWDPVLAFKAADGKVRAMNTNEAARFARTQHEWANTDNAHQSVSDAGEQILETFGAIAR